MKISACSAKYEENRGFWIPINGLGALILYNDNEESEIIGYLKGGEKLSEVTIAKVVISDKYVLCFSRINYAVWVYNKENGIIKYLRYSDRKNNGVLSIVEGNEYVYITHNSFEKDINPFYSMKLDTLEVKEINIDYTKIINRSAITKVVFNDGKLFFAQRKENEIKVISINNKNDRIESFEIKNARFINCISVNNQEIWALYLDINGKTKLSAFSQNGIKIYDYDISKDVQIGETIMMEIPYMIFNDNKIGLVHYSCNMISIITIKDISMYECENVYGKEISEEKGLIYDVDIFKEGLYLFSPSLGFIEKFMWKSLKFEEIKIQISDRQIEKCVQNVVNNGEILRESESISLGTFINVL